MTIDWSAAILFERKAISSVVPSKPGVYQITQQPAYPRYSGTTGILKIGQSRSSLKSELLNHFDRHTAANRLTRIRNRPGVEVHVRYCLAAPLEVSDLERTLLREFEDEHWDIPVLSSQRGYGRTEDSHYRS